MASRGYEKAKERFEQGKVIKDVPEIEAPTFLDLVEFMKKYNKNKEILTILIKEFKELKYDVIHDYTKYMKNDMYYLYGNLLININDKLTKEILDNAEKMAIKRRKMCPPCNSNEMLSIKRSENNFRNLKEIIKFYYIIQNHELYKPNE